MEMVQGCLSVNNLAASGSGKCFAVGSDWKCYQMACRRIHKSSFINREHLWNKNVPTLSLKRFKGFRRADLSVRALWSFKESGNEMKASSEWSESANEDILVFFFQLDLGTRIQYALNMEHYEAAQELRNRLAKVEMEIVKQQETKRGTSAKSEAQDKAIKLLRLREDLQKAIRSENYDTAATLRDEISKLEAESLAVSAKALAYENVEYLFRLGQRVIHNIFGYQAVVCGMDPVCCESTSWMEVAQVDKLSRGPNQPFYQILVNVHDDPNLLVAYVPEENLSECKKQPNMGKFDHPYVTFLFYGMDSAGDFIAIKQLREKYNRPRHEVPVDTSGEDDDSER